MKLVSISVLTLLASTPIVPPTTSVFAPGQECTGCGGSRQAPFTNSPCIDIQETVAGGIVSGTCTGVVNPCNKTPCKMNGTFVVTATGAAGCGDIYIRYRDELGCVGGTIVKNPGETEDFVYNNAVLDCGKLHSVRVYDDDPGHSCNHASDAGFSFTCGECRLINT